MGLVQKGLVNVLQGQNNRYRIGFLSSFESLQSSLVNKPPSPDHTTKTDNATEDDNENTTDWHHPQNQGPREPDAPDMAFIHKLNADFESHFNMPLEHPKVDSVVDRFATQAFGTDTTPGGQKFLIFTRRVSTVATLRDRLLARYIQSIEARVQRCWNAKLEWSGPSVPQEIGEEDEDQNDPETFEYDPSADPFRKAMANKGWLFRYRKTFRASGRNALFFEDDWLGRLCRAGGVDPIDAANNLPSEIWAESWTHAHTTKSTDTLRQQQHRADRLRYIAVQAITRYPKTFGMNAIQAAPWQKAYTIILHNHVKRSNPADTPHRAPELFTTKTLWTHWDEQFNNGPLALPTANSATVCQTNGHEELCKRQVARTILAQNFRLNDTILDLYYADEATPENEPSQQSGKDFAPTFLKWLAHDHPSAQQLRQDCANWLEHLRLIVDSSLDGAGNSWPQLAKNETWPQLYNAAAAVGITGGSGARGTALAQFRTPSLPRVIVCTDTLKEGVDLHLFCDHVLHYGVAWTPGDLEQRVGRVDRYFSQIERRLRKQGTPPDVQLQIGYPHITSSLERAQVERVIARQRIAEQLMDSPIAGTGNDSNELIIGASTPRAERSLLKPFLTREFPPKRRPIVVVSAAEAHAIAAHYKHWYAALVSTLKTHGWTVTPLPNIDEFPKEAKLTRNSQHLELTWCFDGASRHYVLELSSAPPASAKKTKNKRNKNRQNTILARLPVPSPEDTPRTQKRAIQTLLNALEPQHAI